MVVILHPDLEIDLDKPLKKVSGIVTDNGGKISKQDNWGKRKLAYPIKKEEFGVYVYYELELPGASYSKVENALNISDEVLRYLITHPVPKVEKKEEPEEAESDEKSDEKTEEKDEKDVKSSDADEKSGNNEEEDKNDE